MNTDVILGLALIVAGVVDAAVVLFLVAPKVAEPTARMITLSIVLSGSGGMVIFGGLLASGTVSLFGG